MHTMKGAVASLAAIVAAMTIFSGGDAHADGTALVNGAFDTSIEGWTDPGLGTSFWHPNADRYADASSGGAVVMVPGYLWSMSLDQCIPLTAHDVAFQIDFSARVPTAGNLPYTSAYLNTTFFYNGDCTDAAGGIAGPFTTPNLDSWQDFVQSDVVSWGAQSMMVSPTVNRPGGTGDAFAYFDYIWLSFPENADGDACTDGQEMQADPAYGGDRDPHEAWDFYDVDGDLRIDLSDTLAILAKFGLNQNDDGYELSFDRYAPNTQKPWRTALATDGTGIDLTDALASLDSFGHSCDSIG
jgi:hypothetical protein